VSRPLVVTRIAGSEDLPILLALWDELRQVGGRAERAVNPITGVDVRDRLGEVLLDPKCRVVIACADAEPVGMAVLCIVRPDPLSDVRIVQIAHLVVSRAQRHRGVGHGLVSAAADFATERHIDYVTVSAYSSLRDVHRFFARLGFAQVTVRRIAPVAAIRRRIGTGQRTASLTDVARRRTRTMRPIPGQRKQLPTVERIET
jgi:GNAT superfamily N-acetyltransferase